MAPSLRDAAKIPGSPAHDLCALGVEIRPSIILTPDGGPATAFGLGFVWPDFREQRHPPG